MTDSLVNLYKELKNKIPVLQQKLCDFMNKYHRVRRSKEFWWVLAGEYALYAELFSMMAKNDERLLYELQRSEKTPFQAKNISTIIINIINNPPTSSQ